MDKATDEANDSWDVQINTVSEPTQFQSLKSSKILDALGAEAHRAHKWSRSLDGDDI